MQGSDKMQNENIQVDNQEVQKDKINTKREYIALFIVVVSLYLPFLFLIFKWDTPNYSKQDLAQFPTEIDSNYTKELDAWWQDHFPGRSILITANSLLGDKVFHTSTNSSVISGKNAWYYFEPTVRNFQNANDLSDADLDRIANSLRLQKEHVEGMGKEFKVFIIPNKNTIYPEYMPDRYSKIGEQSDIERLYQHFPEAVNMIDVLETAKRANTDDIYHKEDSHWNRLGAYAGYVAIMENFGLQYKVLSYGNYEISDGWEGDLTNMLFPSIESNDKQIIFPGYEQKFAYTKPLGTTEDIEIETKRLDGQEGSLLIFRDSFSNLLIEFLSNSFDTVHYSRAIPYRYELVDKVEADYVAIELVERNINYLHQMTPKIPVNLEAVLGFDYEDGGEIELNYEQDSINKMHYFTYIEGSGVSDASDASDDDKPKNELALDSITRVYVKNASGYFEAFPMAKDEEIQDGHWNYGFSYNLDDESMPEELYVYSNKSETWTRLTPVINN